MLYKYFDWDRKSVKARSFYVYCFSTTLSLGMISLVFSLLNGLDLFSDKVLVDFWGTAPAVAVLFGAISGVVYMYRDMKYQIERLQDSCDILSQSHSYQN
jgi:hypothetical protein